QSSNSLRMKTLYLVRHGKSLWDDISINDLERPLKQRGVDNAEDLTKHLLKDNEIPDLIISSPSVRTYETAKIIADKLKIPSSSFKVNEKLYLPDFSTLLKTILYLSDDFNSVLIVGHEPSLSTCINYFIDKKLDKVITASWTKLVFNTDAWRDISPATLKGGAHRNRRNLPGFKLE
ncbi:MAG: histidine phosphatase family protein, partial [Salibacteraceae bacterium]